jgi:predicted dienelactone hydrolase
MIGILKLVNAPMLSLKFKALLALVSLTLTLKLETKPAIAADTVYLNYGLLQFPIAVDSLEAFAKDGIERPDLRPISSRLTAAQKAEVRQKLLFHVSASQRQQLHEVMPIPSRRTYVYLSRFLYSPTGETLVRNLGQLIQSDQTSNGFHAIRAALVQAEASPEGLSPISFLRAFPTPVHLNGPRLFTLFKQYQKEQAELNAAIAQFQARTDTPSKLKSSDPIADIQQVGPYAVTQQNLALRDRKRDRPVNVELFLPKTAAAQSMPLVVVSNGFGVKPNYMHFLANHLASHGIAVAIPEHFNSSFQRIQNFFLGLVPTTQEFLSSEYYDRPHDISFLLDELQSRPELRLNTQRVGMVTYSFGSVTALSLAGATFDRAHLQQACQTQPLFLNFSMIYQCRALELPLKNEVTLKDSRIQALYLFMPMGYNLYGAQGLGNIDQPVLWQTTDTDPFTPTLHEQLPAVRSLQPERTYAVITRKLAHSAELVDPQAIHLFYHYPKVLATAFFMRRIVQDERYDRYLQPSYAKTLSQSPYDVLIAPPPH